MYQVCSSGRKRYQYVGILASSERGSGCFTAAAVGRPDAARSPLDRAARVDRALKAGNALVTLQVSLRHCGAKIAVPANARTG